jgi:hypothetical protein
MVVFEVHRNGLKLCTAGVGERGVMSIIAMWRSREPAQDADTLELSVGGLAPTDPDHQMHWINAPLQVGDCVTIKVLASPAADPPELSERPRRLDILRDKQEYVREMARELGWTVTEA